MEDVDAPRLAALDIILAAVREEEKGFKERKNRNREVAGRNRSGWWFSEIRDRDFLMRFFKDSASV